MSDADRAPSPSSPRVLVAGTSVAVQNFTRALGSHAVVVPVYSVREALQIPLDGIDAVLCNVRFDESRMFEFLQALAERKGQRNIPVICVRMYRVFSPAVLTAVAEALQVLGVTRFLDLYELREREGLDVALERLRETVLQECARTT